MLCGTSGDVSRSGAVDPGLPEQFAYPAAFGDLIAAVLALIAIAAVVRRSQSRDRLSASSTSWEQSILMIAISLATIYGAAPYMGPPIGYPLSGCRHCS